MKVGQAEFNSWVTNGNIKHFHFISFKYHISGYGIKTNIRHLGTVLIHSLVEYDEDFIEPTFPVS